MRVYIIHSKYKMYTYIHSIYSNIIYIIYKNIIIWSYFQPF